MARRTIETTCCIAGGGPAGMMAGYLMARAGVDTVVLEKHSDFLRDFRGDTVHPSTLEIMRELGLLDALLQRPHQKLAEVRGDFGGRTVRVADFRRLPSEAKFIAFMPQWHFLDFLSDAAHALPAFRLTMKTEVTDLVVEGNRVVGVRAEDEDGPLEIRARLTLGADGRDSLVRDKAGLAVKPLGVPIDVLWFRVPRTPDRTDDTLLHAGPGHIVVTIGRGDYWQCAYIIEKGEAERVRKRGLDAFRRTAAATAPPLADRMDAVQDWDEVKLLTVAVDRLEEWSRPGLVMIGDGAHAMSPVGGVGINLAIQDAVAAANLFAKKLTDGTLADDDLDALRRRRLLPTRVVQFVQRQIQDRIVGPIVTEDIATPSPPLPMLLLDRWPWLRGMAARLIGLGIRREHVRSPKATRI